MVSKMNCHPPDRSVHGFPATLHQTAAYTPFRKEGGMKCNNATKSNRKSGGAQWRDLRCAFRLSRILRLSAGHPLQRRTQNPASLCGLRWCAIFSQCYSDRNHPDQTQVSRNRDEEVCRVGDKAERGQFSRDRKKHSENPHPSRQKPHKVARDRHSRCQQTKPDRVNGSAEQEAKVKNRFHDLC